MKKIIQLSVLTLVIAVGLIFNFKKKNAIASERATGVVSLRNISAVQASAGEYYCAGANEITCTITVITPSGPVTGSSYGPAYNY